jgi:hypothetical protein
MTHHGPVRYIATCRAKRTYPSGRRSFDGQTTESNAMNATTHPQAQLTQRRAALAWSVLSGALLCFAMALCISDLIVSEKSTRARDLREEQLRREKLDAAQAKFHQSTAGRARLNLAMLGNAPELVPGAREPASVRFQVTGEPPTAHCVLTAKAFGDLASQLIHIRPETLECDGLASRKVRGSVRTGEGRFVAANVVDRSTPWKSGSITLAMKPGITLAAWLDE